MKTRILAMLIGLAVGAYLGGFLSSETVYVYGNSFQGADNCYATFLDEPLNGTSATITVPAVDNDGNGVATTLLVQVEKGSGKALVNIDKLVFWADTQSSIRTARDVAQGYTGLSLDKYDIVYTIRANASLIEGPSAGAALTVATIAALQGWEPDPGVMMTGTINPDGSIGRVGGVLEKAVAAKSIGARMLLVPPTQADAVTYDEQKSCRYYGFTQVCDVQQVPHEVDVEEQAGIPVVEVGTIGDAVRYFSGGAGAQA
jgi:uncharacterized protein